MSLNLSHFDFGPWVEMGVGVVVEVGWVEVGVAHVPDTRTCMTCLCHVYVAVVSTPRALCLCMQQTWSCKFCQSFPYLVILHQNQIHHLWLPKRHHYQLRQRKASSSLTRVACYILEEWVSPIHTGYIYIHVAWQVVFVMMIVMFPPCWDVPPASDVFSDTPRLPRPVTGPAPLTLPSKKQRHKVSHVTVRSIGDWLRSRSS